MRNVSLFLASVAFAMMLAHPAYADERCRALSAAASKGNTSEMSSLIASGVEVNCTYAGSYVDEESGKSITYTSSPLHDAAYSARMKPIQLLLSYGANVNIRDSSGDTPLDNIATAIDVMVWEAGSAEEIYEAEDVYSLLKKAGGNHN